MFSIILVLNQNLYPDLPVFLILCPLENCQSGMKSTTLFSLCIASEPQLKKALARGHNDSNTVEINSCGWLLLLNMVVIIASHLSAPNF